MTKEQFLHMINDIDDKFIRELDEDLESGNDPDLIDADPYTVRLKNERASFWKIGVSAAAVLCVITGGIFGISRLRGFLPNTGPCESPISSSSASEPFDIDAANKFEFRTDRAAVNTEKVLKKNNNNFAQINFSCGGISDKNKLFLSVYMISHDGSKVQCVGRTDVSESGKYSLQIDYVKQLVEGAEFFLCLQADNAWADGEWIP